MFFYLLDLLLIFFYNFRFRRERVLESSHEFESSPELSNSFEAVLLKRKQKREEEEKKMNARKFDYSELPSGIEPFRGSFNETLNAIDNTMMQCTEDSFLANEKMCENTIHLNNVSENFFDLTNMESPVLHHKKISVGGDETRLDSVEAPSFLFSNTIMSPLNVVHANRPSTIIELSESAMSSRTNMSSYQTAFTQSEASEYKTADDESMIIEGKTANDSTSLEELLVIKMPKMKSFYDMTKDSLDDSITIKNTIEMSKDSLISFDESIAQSNEPEFNDTLERIEFMLSENQKLQEQQRTPQIILASPVTPRVAPTTTSPFPTQLQLKRNYGAKLGSASKLSPLIKFSPVVKSPANAASAFKKPVPSATKIPKPSSSKKFLNIQSPIARYINNTPVAPQAHTPRTLPGIGTSPKNFNFRDSEYFAKENDNMNSRPYQVPSLPLRAKTKSSAVSQVNNLKYLKLN